MARLALAVLLVSMILCLSWSSPFTTVGPHPDRSPQEPVASRRLSATSAPLAERQDESRIQTVSGTQTGRGSGAVPPLLQFRRPVATKSSAAAIVRSVDETQSIRVALPAGTDGRFMVQCDEPVTIRDLSTGKLLTRPRALTDVPVQLLRQGIQLGGERFPVEHVELQCPSNAGLWVNNHRYRGTIRLEKNVSGRLQVTNRLLLGEYLGSVVDSEMPTDFGSEARKAQCIIARTYALMAIREANPLSLADLEATVRSQKYLGYQYRAADGRLLAGESTAAKEIVQATSGLVCTAQGELFRTYYCAVCGGRTLHGADGFPDAGPQLRSVPCDWCQPARFYRWSIDLTRAQMEQASRSYFARQGIELAEFQGVKQAVTGREPPGPPARMPLFRIQDRQQTRELTGAEFRELLSAYGLKSPRFDLSLTKTGYRISGAGHGHGVGLCQWGAKGQAAEGRTALEILRHYYPGTQIVRWARK